MEVLAGPERRRRWSDEEKCRIVREAQSPEFATLMLRGGMTYRRRSSTSGGWHCGRVG